jgi:O-antigen/teichoic acid export membrane protein
LVYFMPAALGATVVGIQPIVLSLASLGLAVATLVNGALTGLQLFGLIAALNTGSGIVTVGGAVISAIVGEPSIALWSLVISQGIHLFGVPRVWQRVIDPRASIQVGKLARLVAARARVLEVAAYAGPVFLTTLFATTGLWFPGRLLLEGQGGTSAFATFSVGLQLFSLVMLVPIVIDRVFQPRLFRYFWQPGMMGNSKNPTRRSAIASVLSAVVIALIVIEFSNEVLLLYGMELRDGSSVLITFMTVAVLVAPLNAVGNAIIAKAAQKLWLVLMATWFMLLVILTNLLGDLGAPGMALSLLLAYATLLATSLVIGWRMRLFH